MTPQQQRCLAYIREHHDQHGFTPTYQEVAVHLGVASKGGIHRMVDALIAQGHLRRGAGKVRNLEVVDRSAPLILPPDIQRRLERYCLAEGLRPAEVVATLLVSFLARTDRTVAARAALAEASP